MNSQKNYIDLQNYGESMYFVSEKIKESLKVTNRITQSCFKKRAFYYPVGRSIDVGPLSENHHKINLIAGYE